jgi:hypothetical protein
MHENSISESTKKLADVFNINIEPSEDQNIVKSSDADVAPVVPIETTGDSDNDYAIVRNNLKKLINTSEMAIEGIMSVATEGDSPRAFEVVSDLIKTSLEANNKLIELHKNMKELKKPDKHAVKSENITNNSIFVGNTTDLLKMIRNKKIEAPNITKLEP